MTPESRVCPRCGSEADQEEFCSTCGLNLHAQPELPTPQQWEHGKQTGFGTPPAQWNAEATGQKSPWSAAILSALLVGAGQIYAGAWGRGFVWLSSAFVVGAGVALIVGSALGLLSSAIVWIAAAGDAYQVAEQVNRDGPPSWEENRARLPVAVFLAIMAFVLFGVGFPAGVWESGDTGSTGGSSVASRIARARSSANDRAPYLDRPWSRVR